MKEYCASELVIFLWAFVPFVIGILIGWSVLK